MRPKAELIRREGYWKTDQDGCPFPTPRAHEKPWKGKKEFLFNLEIAQRMAQAHHGKGCSTCRICKAANGSVTYEFDGWHWPSGFYHYVEVHNVRPSLAFQEFIMGRYISSH